MRQGCRVAIAIALAGCLAPCGCEEIEAASEARPLNIVVITIDTLRADHLHCYGYPRQTTPRIDAIAERGLVFEQAAAQWPKTGPSMSSLLSSTYGSTSGVARSTMKEKIPLSYELLPELLKGAGYSTFGVVSNMSLTSTFQFDQGFDQLKVAGGKPANAISAAARDLVEKRDPTRPYFLWVHYLDPHAPYKPPQGHGSEYKEFIGDELFESDQRAPVPVDPRVADPVAATAVDGNEVGMIPAYAYLQGKERIRDYVAQYDGDIRFLDEHVGVLVDWLEQSGNLSHTILVVTADHGESLGDHNYFFEHGRFPYDDCVRVPLILLHPDGKPGRISSPVGLIDVAPTLLEMVGVAPGPQFEGRSLLGWLAEGAPESGAHPVFTESGYLKQFEVSIRKGRWKLIKIGSKYVAKMLQNVPYELYDLLDDPGETKNLVDERSEVFEELRPLLDARVELAYASVPPSVDGALALSPEEQAFQKALGYGNDKERAEYGDGRGGGD